MPEPVKPWPKPVREAADAVRKVYASMPSHRFDGSPMDAAQFMFGMGAAAGAIVLGVALAPEIGFSVMALVVGAGMGAAAASLLYETTSRFAYSPKSFDPHPDVR